MSLKKRASASSLFQIVSPLLALALTLLFGAIMFWMLGKNPGHALYAFFIEPLLEVWSLHELAIKAAPLILIAVGLSVCYKSNNWNIGAEGQFTIGAIVGSILPVLVPQWQSAAVLPLMLIMGAVGGALFCRHSSALENTVQYQRNSGHLMLVYIAQLFLDWLVRGAWRDPKGFQLSANHQL